MSTDSSHCCCEKRDNGFAQIVGAIFAAVVSATIGGVLSDSPSANATSVAHFPTQQSLSGSMYSHALSENMKERSYASVGTNVRPSRADIYNSLRDGTF